MTALETLIADTAAEWQTRVAVVCEHTQVISYGQLAEILAPKVRELLAAEIVAKAEPYTDAMAGPRASFRRGLEAAARHILPAPTAQDIADAITRGDAVFCNLPEEP